VSKERIDVLLVERGLCESRARAQARILAGDVIVDDKRIDKAGEKVPRDAVIRQRGDEMPWVSRGGLKLAAALEWFAIDVSGKTCVDVGASTGGFTDVLLSKGAARVYAIDVGYGQLAQKLRVDPRVVNMERTHIVKEDERAVGM
jgi:23S rRNA (cytidine1920-2'-O)/16S rRNA (cytidine1409-2'-O)-methyltransferase